MHSVCIVFDFAVNASRPEREKERPAVETRDGSFLPKAGVRLIIGKVAVVSDGVIAALFLLTTRL